MLSVAHLSCTLSRKCILRDVSFRVERGAFAAVVGPNGAGKSTLLRSLLGLAPTSAETEIRLGGEDVTRLSRKERARRVAYVPQAVPQCFAFTVRQFVEMSRYVDVSPWAFLSGEDREICERSMRQTGVAEYAERTLDTLSGGELQRVWLAAAVAQESELLLLDESVSQMDYRFHAETLGLLRDLNHAGTTVLLVTHDWNDVTLCANQVLVLQDGTLRFDGPPGQFLTPENLEMVYGTPLSLAEVPRRLPLVYLNPQRGEG
ncbi:MAG: ABC transporter ATP-binding protein [Planctomycetia bacterium]|nr:ABC transporter ATP-binding protein [Planctomycetia bacterium]